MIFKNTQQKINYVRINGIPDFKNTILGKQVQRTLKYTTWLCLQRRVLVRLSPLNILPWNEVPEHPQAHPNNERNVPGSMSHLPSRAHKGHSGSNDTLGVAKGAGWGSCKAKCCLPSHYLGASVIGNSHTERPQNWLMAFLLPAQKAQKAPLWALWNPCILRKSKG